MVWKKQKEDERLADETEEYIPRVEETTYEPDISPTKPIRDLAKELKKSDKGREAIEDIDSPAYWNARIGRFQTWVEETGWESAIVGTATPKDAESEHEVIVSGLARLHLIWGAEQNIIGLQCALAPASEAGNITKKLIVKFARMEEELDLDYPRALLGMIHGCLHEQKMGLHTREYSMWDFDAERDIDAEYKEELERAWKKDKAAKEAEDERG